MTKILNAFINTRISVLPSNCQNSFSASLLLSNIHWSLHCLLLWGNRTAKNFIKIYLHDDNFSEQISLILIYSYFLMPLRVALELLWSLLLLLLMSLSMVTLKFLSLFSHMFHNHFSSQYNIIQLYGIEEMRASPDDSWS